MEEPVTTDSPKRKAPRLPAKPVLLVLVVIVLVVGVYIFSSSKKHGHVSEQLFGRDPNFPENTFRVLIVADDARESAPYGASALFGARAAAAKLNEKGGINKQQVVVEGLVAGETDEEATDSVVRYLRKKPVQLVLDATSEWVSPGVLRAAYSEKTLAMIVRDGACRTGSGMSAGKISPFIWSLGLTRESVIEPFLAFLADKRGKPEAQFQVLFLSGDTPIDQETIEAVKLSSESLNFKTIESLTYDVRLQDYYTVARDILGRIPDLVFIANRPEAARLFMEHAHKLALGRDMALAAMSTFDEEWQPLFGKTTEGVFTVARYASGIDNPENKEFLSYLNRGAPKDPKLARRAVPTASAALSWGAVIIFDQAAAQVKSVDATAISGKLGSLEFKLPNGHAFFDPKNHVLVQKMYGLRIKESKYEVVESLGDAHHPETTGCN